VWAEGPEVGWECAGYYGEHGWGDGDWGGGWYCWCWWWWLGAGAWSVGLGCGNWKGGQCLGMINIALLYLSPIASKEMETRNVQLSPSRFCFSPGYSCLSQMERNCSTTTPSISFLFPLSFTVTTTSVAATTTIGVRPCQSPRDETYSVRIELRDGRRRRLK
jgi:hypothetical protein